MPSAVNMAWNEQFQGKECPGSGNEWPIGVRKYPTAFFRSKINYVRNVRILVYKIDVSHARAWERERNSKIFLLRQSHSATRGKVGQRFGLRTCLRFRYGRCSMSDNIVDFPPAPVRKLTKAELAAIDGIRFTGFWTSAMDGKEARARSG